MIARGAWGLRAVVTEVSRFVFIDESGAKTTMTRLYGRGFDGARVYDHVPHGHWGWKKGTIVPFIFFNKEKFVKLNRVDRFQMFGKDKKKW